MDPIIKPPKIEKTPIRLVIHAETKTRIKMAARALREISPWFFLIWASAHLDTGGRTINTMKAAKKMTWVIMRKVRAALKLECAMAVTRARMIQPATSSMAAAEM